MNPDPEDETSLESIIAAYLRDGRAGRKPDRTWYLERYPDFAGDLEAFFAEYDEFDRMASPLREIGREIQSRSDGHIPTLNPTREGQGFAPVPRDFGGFELIRVLGSGGMGVVYEARQEAMNRSVALKMIHGGEWASIDDVQRFRNEVESIARLAHPNIVPIHAVGETRGHHYYSMPLMGGGSLADRLDRLSADPKAAARMMIDIARAVEYAHRRGIIHRDLKPSNVLLDDADRPHVSDFGLARRIGEDSSLTGTGVLVGSPPYMAPEQSAGRSRDLTTATDVYGLGAILYATLTGRPPFRGGSPLEVLERARHREPDRPRSINRRVDADLETICLKCLEKEPNRRYAGAEALAEDLGRWLEGRPIRARRSGPARNLAKWSRRHPALAILSTTLAVGAPAAFLATFAAYRASERKRSDLDASLYQTRIALAEREVELSNIERAEELLGECPVPLRGWEWHYLKRRRLGPPTILATPDDSPWSVAFSPDGRRLATGHVLGGVRLWETSTGRELARLAWPSSTTNGLAFSPDGRLLAGSSIAGGLRVWEVSGGRVAWDLAGSEGFWEAAFSPDGRWLAAAGFDRALSLFDAETGRGRRALGGHSDRVTGVAFHPGGLEVASSSDDGSVKVWDLATGSVSRTLSEGSLLPLRAVRYSRDGRTILSGTHAGEVVAWDGETGRELFRRAAHIGTTIDLAVSPDGRHFASSGGESVVRVCDIRDGRERIGLRGHSAPIRSVAFSPDGRRLASAGLDGTTRVWDARPWEDRPSARFLGRTEGLVEDVAFDPEGRTVASVDLGRTVNVWDVRTGRELASFEGGSGALKALAFDPKGRYLAAAGFGKSIRLFDSKDWSPIGTLVGHRRAVQRLAIAPDGERLASAGADWMLKVWDLSTGREVYSRQPGAGYVLDVAFHPGGRQLAASAGGGFVAVYEADSGRLLRKFRPNRGRVNAVGYDRAGRRLAVAGTEGLIEVYETEGWTSLVRWKEDDYEIYDVAFSPDDRLLATIGNDHLLKVRDAAEGRVIVQIRECVPPENRLDFSPDGNHLAATGGDRSVRVWDLRKPPFPPGLMPEGGPTAP